MKRLSLEQARRLHLAAQGLITPPKRATREAALRAIARMQVLQIDTIHVVARSPYLVLFSRLGAYRPEWLDELLEEARIFECWAHEACFAPMADHALHEAARADRDGHWAARSAKRTSERHSESMASLLAHIREKGPVKAADFERKTGASGWWGWKDEKRWLEALFASGELMITHRERFQRVYDLRERVLAKARVQPEARYTPEQARRELVLRAVRALGVARPRWIADYFRTPKKPTLELLPSLVSEGLLQEVDLAGQLAYVHRDDDPSTRARATYTTLLSPFDPVVWDRARASELFEFDYRIECYTPEDKRKYGYYVLPILHRGELVGRLDAKAHRADGVFEVKSLHLERPAELDEVAAAIRRCAEWHGTPDVVFRKTTPRSVRRSLA